MGFVSKAIFAAVVSAALYQVLHYALYDAYAVWKYAPTRESTAGKRVLITGSSKGIGRELGMLYSELGAHVTIHSRSLSSLTEISTECRKRGAASVHMVTGDMSTLGEAERVVKSAAELMGGLDIVIVNHISTYVLETLYSTVARLKTGEVQRDFQVDLFSYAEAALAAVPLLEPSSGSIVFVSSGAGRFPMPYFYEYGFAKRSLEGLVAALRQELALNGSSVHAGIAVLGAIDTQSAHDALGDFFRSEIDFAPVRPTAMAIASMATGRLREVVTPWRMRYAMLMSALSSLESVERGLRNRCKRL